MELNDVKGKLSPVGNIHLHKTIRMELKKYELIFAIGLLIKCFNFHRELKRFKSCRCLYYFRRWKDSLAC
jgi:hypothetical protein